MRALLFLCALLMCGCAVGQSSPPSGMDVDVILRAVHRCSRISPEIHIFGVPDQTASFDVRLEDRSNPRKFHGGGTWKNDGTGIIPEGALTRHYIGACPPAGTPRSYQYVVIAQDVNNVPLSARIFVFEQD